MNYRKRHRFLGVKVFYSNYGKILLIYAYIQRKGVFSDTLVALIALSKSMRFLDASNFKWLTL